MLDFDYYFGILRICEKVAADHHDDVFRGQESVEHVTGLIECCLDHDDPQVVHDELAEVVYSLVRKAYALGYDDGRR